MNDFRIIRNDEPDTKLRPSTYNASAQQTDGRLKSVLADRKDSKVVVVGHHAPTLNSIHEKYRHNVHALMNGGYASDLSEFILDRSRLILLDSWSYARSLTLAWCNGFAIAYPPTAMQDH
jgi:hypothetical protein